MTTSFYAPPTLQVYPRPEPMNLQPGMMFEIRTLESLRFNDFILKNKFLIQEHYEIIWIKKGAAELGFNTKTQHIQEHYAVLLFPGQRYFFQPVVALEGYSIIFSQEFLFLSGHGTFDLFHSARQTSERIFPAIQLDSSLLLEMDGIVISMFREFVNQFKCRSEALQGLLKMMIVHLLRKIDYPATCPVTGAEGELLKRFLYMINSHFFEKKLVHAYASDLFVTPSYLNEVIKKNTGFTASYHIQQRIILEAKRLAINSEMRMKEIAAQLGFEDCAHFSKFFKTNSGTNFTAFRKQMFTTSGQ